MPRDGAIIPLLPAIAEGAFSVTGQSAAFPDLPFPGFPVINAAIHKTRRTAGHGKITSLINCRNDVACRQRNDLIDPAVKERVRADEQRAVRSRSRTRYRCRVRYSRSKYSIVAPRHERPLERPPTEFGNSRWLG